MIVDLLRHGSTGRADRLDGRGNFPLTAEGRAEALRQTASGVWSRVWSSPLMRARETAADVAARLSVPLGVDADWAEMDFGAWEGRVRADIAMEIAAFHGDPAAHPPPGGESWACFEARIAAGLARVLAADGPALVITHAGPLRMALSLACGLPFDRLWCLRIGTATRVRLELGRSEDRFWGEIIEVAQP